MVQALMAICLLVVMGTAVPMVYAGAKFEMSYYSMQPPFIPVSGCMEQTKKFLEKESNGDIEVKLFLGGQLGAESAGINKLKIGTVQTANLSAVAISTIEPKVNILQLPFVFNTWDDVEKFLNSFDHSPVIAEIGKSLEKKGLKLMGMQNYGFFRILSTKKFIATKDDMKGIKIRVYPTQIMVDLYQMMGAVPTPIAFPEIYTALQQGVIDATDSSLDASYASKQYEVAKYLTMTDHVHGWWLLVANKTWFDKLPKETQDLVSEGFRRCSKCAIKGCKEYEEKILKIYKEAGVQTKALTDQERKEFRKATVPVHQKYRSKIGADFLEKFYKETGYK
jgi:tripartite ATP-independent transporter DctP family solute receptor